MRPKPPVLEGKEVDGDKSPSTPTSFRVGGHFGIIRKVWQFPTLKAITLELSNFLSFLSFNDEGSEKAPTRVFGLEDMTFCWLSLSLVPGI